MGKFSGFPTRSSFTPIHNIFFSELIPQISDLSELKVVLHIFRALHDKKGFPRFVTRAELLATRSLMVGLRGFGKPPEDMLDEGLELAEKRGIILHLQVTEKDKRQELFLLNTERDREYVSQNDRASIDLKARLSREETPAVTDGVPNIFTLYEQNISILTPLISDELREAEKLYPAEWIEEAFLEAVANNKRNWRHIARILERWTAEGRDGKPGGHSKKEDDYRKYTGGRYGHLVKH